MSEQGKGTLEAFEARFHATLDLKGLARPVNVHEILAERGT